MRNICLSANNVPGLDLGCQDSYRTHLPHRPRHDPADHDFSLAGSYPGSFWSLMINKIRHHKWEWLSAKKNKDQSFIGTKSSRFDFRCTSLCVCMYMGISYHLHPCRHRMHLQGHQNRCLSGLGYPLGYSCHMCHHDCPYHCSADLYLASTSSYPKIHTYTHEQSILNNQR